MLQIAEMYSKPCQTSNMKHKMKIVNGSIRLGSEYGSALTSKNSRSSSPSWESTFCGTLDEYITEQIS